MNELKHQEAIIFVIDSDSVSRETVRKLLTEQGIDVIGLENCQEARTKVRYCLPDLIVCATRLNGMDGIQLCQNFTQAERLINVPVVFLSDSDDPNSLSRSRAAGGTFCLTRPFDPRVMLELVDKALWMPHLIRTHLDHVDGPSGLKAPRILPTDRSFSTWK